MVGQGDGEVERVARLADSAGEQQIELQTAVDVGFAFTGDGLAVNGRWLTGAKHPDQYATYQQ